MTEISIKDLLPAGVAVAIKGILLRNYDLNDPDDLALLDQDILEIELSNGRRIDVGWFPENDPAGRFVIRVFRNGQLTPVSGPIETTDPQAVATTVRDLILQCEPQTSARAISAS